jgi:acyl-CoA synthetase (AMP-forming)/AMP-acid ligase II
MGRPENPLRVDRAGNVANGRPLPGLEVDILDEAGRALPPGEVGEITVRGPSVFSGYLDDEAATREVLRDGRLHTGDTGYLDAEGFLFILGRTKSLIKRGGGFISPREVEMAAEQVPPVRIAAAIGVTKLSALASEELVIVAEVSPEATDSPGSRDAIGEAIAAAVENAVGHAPSDVVLLKPRSIPRTGNGKIQHGRLRELYSDGALGGQGQAS